MFKSVKLKIFYLALALILFTFIWVKGIVKISPGEVSLNIKGMFIGKGAFTLLPKTGFDSGKWGLGYLIENTSNIIHFIPSGKNEG